MADEQPPRLHHRLEKQTNKKHFVLQGDRQHAYIHTKAFTSCKGLDGQPRKPSKEKENPSELPRSSEKRSHYRAHAHIQPLYKSSPVTPAFTLSKCLSITTTQTSTLINSSRNKYLPFLGNVLLAMAQSTDNF